MSIWSNYLWYFWVVVLVWLGACLTGKHTNSSLNMWVLEGSSLLGVGCTKESIGTYLRKCLFQKWLCRCVKGYTLFVQIFFLSISCMLSNLKFTICCHSMVWHSIQRDCMSMEVLWRDALFWMLCNISRKSQLNLNWNLSRIFQVSGNLKVLMCVTCTRFEVGWGSCIFDKDIKAL